MNDVLRTDFQKSVAEYWNTNQQDPVNLRLGEVDGLYHHHYGIGDYDPSVLEGPEDTRQECITEELHRLETAQADVLLDHLGAVTAADRLLDAGSGRGGTSFMANQRFGCQVDGVSISEYQVGFANRQAEERGVADRVRFHFRNMLDTGFETASRRGVWTNETTMYVDLFELFGEFSRVLEHGGRYVCITGCYNDLTGGRSKAVSRIDEHYTCNIHPRSEYFKAMAANRLVPMQVVDLTAQTIPYWELRAKSALATGIEDPFLTAYKEGSFHYLLIAADRV
ncbi:geranyl diphosphate 2-C-methyltransferase [Streptomyces sp. TRM64462]|uniref:geranyl diphosphate 2-C-methyltransferase n=1 Tax=Streptomyces sp. TRM64462 TaxID=2741726 RepID=UPI001586D565|nr:geranyl diphosphate 2-C-methyltransferase [Streptomyces sp. TRM64462]